MPPTLASCLLPMLVDDRFDISWRIDRAFNGNRTHGDLTGQGVSHHYPVCSRVQVAAIVPAPLIEIEAAPLVGKEITK